MSKELRVDLRTGVTEVIEVELNTQEIEERSKAKRELENIFSDIEKRELSRIEIKKQLSELDLNTLESAKSISELKAEILKLRNLIFVLMSFVDRGFKKHG